MKINIFNLKYCFKYKILNKNNQKVIISKK